jgi:hypothetical protein
MNNSDFVESIKKVNEALRRLADVVGKIDVDSGGKVNPIDDLILGKLKVALDKEGCDIAIFCDVTSTGCYLGDHIFNNEHTRGLLRFKVERAIKEALVEVGYVK